MQGQTTQDSGQASEEAGVEVTSTDVQDESATQVMIVSADGTAGAFVAHELATACAHWGVRKVTGDACAVEVIGQRAFNCVLLVAGPGQTANLDLVPQLHSHSIRGACPVVLVCDAVEPELVVRSRQAGVAAVIPWDALNASYLELAVTSALGQWRLMRVIDLLNQQVEEKQQRRSTQRLRTERFAHELLTPLASVQEYISLVFDEISGPINTEQASHLAYARGGCATIEASIEALVVAASNHEMHPIGDSALDDEYPSVPTIAATVQPTR